MVAKHWRRWTLISLLILFIGAVFVDIKIGFSILSISNLVKVFVIGVACAITRIGKRNKVGLVLIMLSFAVLYPGLTQNMLTMDMSTKVKASIPQFKQQVADFETTIMNKKRSILGTVSDLYSNDKNLVASLILLFSAIIPVVKGLLLLIVLFNKNYKVESALYNFVKTIGKWSMADVFVVAIFLGYLAMKDQVQQVYKEVSVMTMKMDVHIDLVSDAFIGEGFWYFLTYCLMSLTALHFIRISPKPTHS